MTLHFTILETIFSVIIFRDKNTVVIFYLCLTLAKSINRLKQNKLLVVTDNRFSFDFLGKQLISSKIYTGKDRVAIDSFIYYLIILSTPIYC